MTVTNQNSYHAKFRRNHLTGLQIYDAGKIWVENSIFTGIQSVGLQTYFAVKIGTERINISSVGSQTCIFDFHIFQERQSNWYWCFELPIMISRSL